MLLVIHIHLVFEPILSVPYRKARQLPWRGLELDHMPVVKHNTIEPLIYPIARVQVQKHFSLKTRMHFEPPADKVQTGNGWMMANLLCIDRAAVNHPLISLT